MPANPRSLRDGSSAPPGAVDASQLAGWCTSAWLRGASYQLAASLAGRLPRRWALALGARGGELAWAFQSRRRRALARNWSLLTPPGTGEIFSSRRGFRRFGEELVETMRLWHAPADEVRRRVQFHGFEPVARSVGLRTVLVLTLHSGNWEWAGAALATRGIPVQALARPQARPVERVFRAARCRFGVETVSHPDELAAARGCVAVFLDRLAPAATASPHRLARRAMALAARRHWLVVPCWTERLDAGRYRVTFGPLQEAPRHRRERERGTEAILGFLETRAAQRPEEWFAFERLEALTGGRPA